MWPEQASLGPITAHWITSWSHCRLPQEEQQQEPHVHLHREAHLDADSKAFRGESFGAILFFREEKQKSHKRFLRPVFGGAWPLALAKELSSESLTMLSMAGMGGTTAQERPWATINTWFSSRCGKPSYSSSCAQLEHD